MLVGSIQRKDSYLNKCEKHWIQNKLARFIISVPLPGLEYANVHCNYLVGPAHGVFPGHLPLHPFLPCSSRGVAYGIRLHQGLFVQCFKTVQALLNCRTGSQLVVTCGMVRTYRTMGVPV